jgi:hypothetical protein
MAARFTVARPVNKMFTRRLVLTFVGLLGLSPSGYAQTELLASPYVAVLGAQVILAVAVFASFCFGKDELLTAESDERPPFLTVAGQGTIREDDTTFVRIAGSVTGAAEVAIEATYGLVVLNFVKAKPDGSPDDVSRSSIHLLRGAGTRTLDQLHDGGKLEPGVYYLLVVAAGRIAKVKITAR